MKVPSLFQFIKNERLILRSGATKDELSMEIFVATNTHISAPKVPSSFYFRQASPESAVSCGYSQIGKIASEKSE